MPRLPRVVAVDSPHHVTQRGNARQGVFQSDADRLVYLELLGKACRQYRLSLLGYCLMSNHVHLIVVPPLTDSLPLALKYVHGRYATYFNARHASSGHLWQGRYYSCPLDPPHLWVAMQYTELNPVRAGMAEQADAYLWSSAAAHCGSAPPAALLELSPWQNAWDPATWREFLGSASETEADAIRRSTHTGRPLGAPEFVARLEKTLHRRLAPEKGGRPPTREIHAKQQSVALGRR